MDTDTLISWHKATELVLERIRDVEVTMDPYIMAKTALDGVRTLATIQRDAIGEALKDLG